MPFIRLWPDAHGHICPLNTACLSVSPDNRYCFHVCDAFLDTPRPIRKPFRKGRDLASDRPCYERLLDPEATGSFFLYLRFVEPFGGEQSRYMPQWPDCKSMQAGSKIDAPIQQRRENVVAATYDRRPHPQQVPHGE